jgi:hypothetical protein
VRFVHHALERLQFVTNLRLRALARRVLRTMIAERNLAPEEKAGIATQSRETHHRPQLTIQRPVEIFHRDFATPPGAFAKSLRISHKPRGAVE